MVKREPEVTYGARLLKVSPEFADRLAREEISDDLTTRIVGVDQVNVLIPLRNKAESDRLAKALSRISPSPRFNVFVSLRPLDDSGIKDVPHHILKLLTIKGADLTLSYTFLN